MDNNPQKLYAHGISTETGKLIFGMYEAEDTLTTGTATRPIYRYKPYIYPHSDDPMNFYKREEVDQSTVLFFSGSYDCNGCKIWEKDDVWVETDISERIKTRCVVKGLLTKEGSIKVFHLEDYNHSNHWTKYLYDHPEKLTVGQTEFHRLDNILERDSKIKLLEELN